MNQIKIYEFTRDCWGFAFKRISKALKDYAPKQVRWVSNPKEADLILAHVVGAGELDILKYPKPKVIIQHCYFTADGPNLNYDEYWKESVLTVSFHDLRKYTDKEFPYYGMPWGADPKIFRIIPNIEKDVTVFATGHVAETEAIDKLYEAAKILNTKLYHTGEDFKWDTNFYNFMPYMSDKQLGRFLNRVKYVSGMRLTEGFELMCIEGMFCGSRPIIPENDTYDWYRQYSHTVDTKQNIVDQFIEILKQEPKPIDGKEYKEIVHKFSWNIIIGDFYKHLFTKLGIEL